MCWYSALLSLWNAQAAKKILTVRQCERCPISFYSLATRGHLYRWGKSVFTHHIFSRRRRTTEVDSSTQSIFEASLGVTVTTKKKLPSQKVDIRAGRFPAVLSLFFWQREQTNQQYLQYNSNKVIVRRDRKQRVVKHVYDKYDAMSSELVPYFLLIIQKYPCWSEMLNVCTVSFDSKPIWYRQPYCSGCFKMDIMHSVSLRCSPKLLESKDHFVAEYREITAPVNSTGSIKVKLEMNYMMLC